jgi:hypothetical protein
MTKVLSPCYVRSNWLEVVYTMDHEVVPCSSKTRDWLMNSSQDHFSLYQEKNVRVHIELEVPKRPSFKPTLSIIMFQQVL